MNMTRFFTLLTGDCLEVVSKHGPASRKKVIAIGTGLLLVTALWFFTGLSLGLNAIGLALAPAIILGFVLALLVFLLDRMILLITKCGWGIVLLRGGLAICMALIGSAGLDICLLRSEIDQMLITMHRERMDEVTMQIQRAHAEALVTAGERVMDARNAKQRAGTTWLAELDGTAGTGRYGSGKVAAAKESVLVSRTLELADAQKQLDVIKSQMETEMEQAKQALILAQGTPALFDRLEALHRYVRQNTTSLIAYILLSVVLLLIELSPLIAKWGMASTAYEENVLAQDRVHRERMQVAMSMMGKHHARQLSMTQAERNSMAVLGLARQRYEAAYTRTAPVLHTSAK